MMKITGDKVIFSTGLEMYANQGIVGLNSDLEIFEGYDSHFEGFERQLNSAENAELADYMISLWQKVKDRNVVT